MTPTRQRTLGLTLIGAGVVGLIATLGASAAGPTTRSSVHAVWGPYMRARPAPACTAPELPGRTVDVVLSDMGGMMTGGRMMSVTVAPSTVASGDVSLRVWDSGMTVHELVVLPLPAGGPGARSVGSDGRVSEAGSLGEASRSCGEGSGDGIAPGATGWVTLHLDPGRYELICNLPGHYAAGMFAELDVS